jgi:hypothetical protein
MRGIISGLLVLAALVFFQPCPASAATAPTVLESTPVSITATAGSSFNITSNWKAVPLPISYEVFVHFTDSSGNIIFQDNYYPSTLTTAWSGPVSYTRTVTVPAAVAAGTYQVRVGLYSGRPSCLDPRPRRDRGQSVALHRWFRDRKASCYQTNRPAKHAGIHHGDGRKQLQHNL